MGPTHCSSSVENQNHQPKKLRKLSKMLVLLQTQRPSRNFAMPSKERSSRISSLKEQRPSVLWEVLLPQLQQEVKLQVVPQRRLQKLKKRKNLKRWTLVVVSLAMMTSTDLNGIALPYVLKLLLKQIEKDVCALTLSNLTNKK